jgi:hypothetical protein
MNHSTEIAQGTTGKVTAKQLLAVVRHATQSRFSGGSVFMHADAVYGRPSYSDAFTFDLSATDRWDSRQAITTKITVPGCVRGGHTSKREDREYDGRTEKHFCEAYKPTRGHWSLMCRERSLADVLELLPRDAEVSFEVHLDAGTNQYLANAVTTPGSGTERGLHADHLYLVAKVTTRGKAREMRFLIDTTAGAHNSARFGSPRHDEDTTGRPGW